MQLRDATTADADLLARMLLAAYNWSGEERVTAERLRTDPLARRHLVGWRRGSDLGVVAEDDGPGPRSVHGAAWARVLPRSAAGYGWVADDVPELSMAVEPGSRGRGVGAALLAALVDRARARGVRGLSLSVEDGNAPARHLYEQQGFGVVGRNGGSDTMLLTLEGPGPDPPTGR